MLSHILYGALGPSLGTTTLLAPLSHAIRAYSATGSLKTPRAKSKATGAADAKPLKGSKAAGTNQDSAKKSAKVKGKAGEATPRSTSAWSFFVQDVSPKIRAEGVPHKEVFKQCSERWKALSDAEKAPYEQLHLQSKEVAEKAREKAKANRAPPTGYARFVKDNLPGIQAQMPNLSAVERMAEVSKKWHALSKAEQQAYLQQAKAELAKWKAAQGLATA